jgi:hypothetical protein
MLRRVDIQMALGFPLEPEFDSRLQPGGQS